MKRRTGFEWEDQPWFPSLIRQYMMDFLRFVFSVGNLYQPITPSLIEGLQQTKRDVIVDLCSGGGGAVPSIQNNIKKATGKTIPFLLTDLYPNITAYQQLEKDSHQSITYYKDAVDAALVPPALQGFRTIFSGFHHFDEKSAIKVLQNAADANEGIAIFDGGNRSIGFMLLILFFHPVAFFLFTPFIKPFSLRRLLFTYLIPIVPLCAIWDGIASVLRLYTPEELLLITKQIQGAPYQWQAGFVTNGVGIRIAYLIGYPKITGL